MHKLMIIFHSSEHTFDLEEQWSEAFVAQAEQMPGLLRVAVSRVHERLVDRLPIHLIHELFFEDEAALRSALASPAGQAAGEALMRFAAKDVTLVMAEHLEESRGSGAPGASRTASNKDEDIHG